MLDYHDALATLLAGLTPPAADETLPLSAAANRTLSRALPARVDTPSFDNSAMDGYALCDPDATRTAFCVTARVAAGDNAAGVALQPGEAARIFTGAPLPAGATAVVAQEDTRRDEDTLHLDRPARAGQHIRRRAEEYAAGGALLAAGSRLTPAAIALAASQGYATLPVRPRLGVTVFSSGNELVEPGAELLQGQIYDANRYQLIAWLAGFDVTLRDGGILPDDAAHTRAALAEASLASDVILTSGGVSVGEEDHVRAALEAIGTLTAWKLAIKPGKPFAWGQAGRARVFMLPGNPVATFVTFFLLVAPALRTLSGEAAAAPRALPVRAAFVKGKLEPRREFLRARLRVADGALLADLMAGQGSAMLSACAGADALVEIPPAATVAEGDLLNAYLINGAFQ